jgi:hypothetical protein
VDVFHSAAELDGLPACFLSDNGAVFSATPRKGKVLLQAELERLGITPMCRHTTSAGGGTRTPRG